MLPVFLIGLIYITPLEPQHFPVDPWSSVYLESKSKRPWNHALHLHFHSQLTVSEDEDEARRRRKNLL